MITVTELKQQIDSKYRDSFGLITQADRDGGDTLNRTACYYGALAIVGHEDLAEFWTDRALICTGLPMGRYRRHPDTTKWYSNPNNVTRDQMAPMEAALVLNNRLGTLLAHVMHRRRRCLFHFSTEDVNVKWKLPDAPSPQELAVIIRGLKLWVLAPVLLLLDLALVASVYSDIREGQPILNIAVAMRRYKTPVAHLARFLLKKKLSAVGELYAYYAEGPGKNGIEPLGELMVLALEAL